MRDDGTLPDDGLVQCATLDRIPFVMKRKDLASRYQPKVEEE